MDTPSAAAADVAAVEDEAEEDPDAFTVLDQLVATILSQNTTDSNSWPAFLKLKAAFPTWDAARTADVAAIAAPIRSAGLSNVKSERIKAILADLHARLGRCSLEHLRRLPDAEAKAELRRFKGVGEKTVACVLMFALGRAEFPVDTHVVRPSCHVSSACARIHEHAATIHGKLTLRTARLVTNMLTTPLTAPCCAVEAGGCAGVGAAARHAADGVRAPQRARACAHEARAACASGGAREALSQRGGAAGRGAARREANELMTWHA